MGWRIHSRKTCLPAHEVSTAAYKACYLRYSGVYAGHEGFICVSRVVIGERDLSTRTFHLYRAATMQALVIAKLLRRLVKDGHSGGEGGSFTVMITVVPNTSILLLRMASPVSLVMHSMQQPNELDASCPYQESKANGEQAHAHSWSSYVEGVWYVGTYVGFTTQPVASRGRRSDKYAYCLVFPKVPPFWASSLCCPKET
jgi:hypothetical protein